MQRKYKELKIACDPVTQHVMESERVLRGKNFAEERTSLWVANTAQTAGRSGPTNSSLMVQRLVGTGI